MLECCFLVESIMSEDLLEFLFVFFLFYFFFLFFKIWVFTSNNLSSYISSYNDFCGSVLRTVLLSFKIDQVNGNILCPYQNVTVVIYDPLIKLIEYFCLLACLFCWCKS